MKKSDEVLFGTNTQQTPHQLISRKVQCHHDQSVDLETQPVYLSTHKHIESHFLTCFVSLVIARLLVRRLKGKYSIPVLMENLRKAACSHIEGNYYLFDYYDEVLADTGKAFGIDFGKKCLSLGAIKKILGKVKKG
ncbi:hypothetical protein ABNN70_06000 [Sporolactobacillus sp. Y61]|uniref:Transposase n=1 Tax=Sporolactobacillus sp. Y61 TaxID=3160863 RepID=A0AAU8II40_9BACL